MPFDPDKYLATKSAASGFDPDAYLAKFAKKPEGIGKTLLDQAGNAILLGYGPEVIAGATKIAQKITGSDSPIPSYTKLRDETYKEFEKERQDNPKAALTGTLGGAVLTSLLPVGHIAKAATGAGRIGRAATTGAVIGGVSNPGAKEGEIDLLQTRERIANAAIGAGAGAVFQGGLEALTKAPGVSSYLKRLANEKSFKSTGAKLKDFQKAIEKNQVQNLGQTMLDEGITTVGATPQKIVERIKPKLDDAGKQIEHLITSADSAIGGPSLDNQVLVKQLKSDLTAGKAGIPGGGSYLKKVDEFLEDLASNGKELTLKQAWRIKRGIDDVLESSYRNKTFEQFPMADEALLAIRNRLRDSINLVVDGTSEAIGSQAGALRAQLSRYGNLAEASRIATKEMARNAANRTISLTDTIAAVGGLGLRSGAGAGAGYALGGDTEDALLGAGLAAGGNKLLRTYGNPASAVALRAMGQGISALQRRLGGVLPRAGAATRVLAENPSATSSVLQRIVNQAKLTAQREADKREEKK